MLRAPVLLDSHHRLPAATVTASGRVTSHADTTLHDAQLYLCTDARREQGDLEEFLDAVLSNGVDIVQLRHKNLEAREELGYLEIFADATRRHRALLAVNDRADVAVAAGADVIHLGQGDLPAGTVRSIVGPTTLIGQSTHTPEQADAAASTADVDYFCCGPTWPTPTKPGRSAAGLELLRHAASLETSRPWFAIGGIDLSNLDEVLATGARRVVVVRAITQADDPGAAAAEFARQLHTVVS